MENMNFFKRNILFIIVLLSIGGVRGQSTESITFTFDITDFVFETDANGQSFVTSARYSLVYDEDSSKPAIPYRIVNVLIRADEIYSDVTFTYEGAIKKSGIKLALNPEKIEVERGAEVEGAIMYPAGLYPEVAKRGYFLRQGLLDGHRILSFQFTPFQYDATKEELILYTKVTMRIVTEAVSYDIPESKGSMNDLVLGLVSNADKKEVYYHNPSLAGPMEWGPGYLIICPENLRQAFEPLRQWKMEKGMQAITRTLEDICEIYEDETNPIKIKRCIQDYYLHHGVKYVLLAWNGIDFPLVYCRSDQIPTDWFYACLDDSEEFAFDWDADGDGILGNTVSDKVDLYPEVIVARAPVATEADVAAFVNKTLNYERTPPMDDWYKDVLLTGVRLWEPDEGPRESEVYAKRLYRNYIEPYFPADTQTLFGNKFFDSKEDPACLDVEEFQEKIEEGFHIIYLTAHGETKQFCLSAQTGDAPEGREYYNVSHAMEMQSDKPSVFVALSCWTQAFDTSENLARHFIINPENGVLAYLGSTRPCFLQGMHTMHGSMFRELLNDGVAKRKLGLAYTQAKAANANDVTHTYMFNMYGDPEMKMYLARPLQFTNIDVSLMDGQYILDAGVDNCTFAVRYKQESGTIYKREYRKNVRTYGVSYSEIKNCEITLMHDDYIPVTFTITPEYIQNITYTGKVKVSGDVILAGRAITEQKPIGMWSFLRVKQLFRRKMVFCLLQVLK